MCMLPSPLTVAFSNPPLLHPCCHLSMSSAHECRRIVLAYSNDGVLELFLRCRSMEAIRGKTASSPFPHPARLCSCLLLCPCSCSARIFRSPPFFFVGVTEAYSEEGHSHVRRYQRLSRVCEIMMPVREETVRTESAMVCSFL
jgi:hypothetical protein